MSRPPSVRTLSAVILASVLTACGGGEPPDDPIALTASPVPAPSATEPLEEPTPSPTPTPSATGTTPSPTPSPTTTGPTDTDRARFVAGHRPEGASDLDSVAADLDGDATKELVFFFVDTGTGLSRIEIAWWQAGDGYRIGFRDEGGRAERIAELRVRDVNADGAVEIATFQDASSRRSLALWQVTGPGEVARLVARGGCHAGSHVYGAIGADFVQADADPAAEISATCNDAPLPVSEWSRDVYDWRDGAYRVVQPPDEGTERDGSGSDGTEQD